MIATGTNDLLYLSVLQVQGDKPVAAATPLTCKGFVKRVLGVTQDGL